MTDFKLGQRIIGPFFVGIVVEFEDYHGLPHLVEEQPTTHSYWRVGIKLESSNTLTFPAGSILYFFKHDFSGLKLSPEQPEGLTK